jgi:hypothetical protein
VAVRDPLSVKYDGVVHGLLIRAAAASAHGSSVQAWIASPRAEFRHRDKGGRTAHERAFTRSVYYQVWWEPVRDGAGPVWSAKLTWGTDEERQASSHGRLSRPVLVRLYPRSKARVSGERWTDNPSMRIEPRT